jgi:guanine deaminase
MTEQAFMQRAVALAIEKMRANSGGPFGAVIVRNNTIISEGTREDQTTTPRLYSFF